MHRYVSIVLVAILLSVSCVIGTARPAAAAYKVFRDPFICTNFPYYTTEYEWDEAAIKDRYGHSAQVQKVEFRWEIRTGGYHVTTAQKDGHYAYAVTPALARTVEVAVLVIVDDHTNYVYYMVGPIDCLGF